MSPKHTRAAGKGNNVIPAGATLLEAATLADNAAGVVVGKVGTATATAEELVASFEAERERKT